MTFSADTMRLMQSKGLSFDDVIEIAESIETSSIKARSPSAERMARKRERDKKSQSGVTCDASQNETKKESTKEKNIYITPETPNGVSSPKRSRRKPETPLPADCPSAEQISESAEHCAAAGVKIDLKFQASRFRNWAMSKDARYRDWGATWRNWVSNAIERAGGVSEGEVPPQIPKTQRSELIRVYRETGSWHPAWGERPTKEELAA